MQWTLGRAGLATYIVASFAIAAFAATGQLGRLTLTASVDWVLVGWLAGYATIVTLVIGGVVHTVVRGFWVRIMGVK